MTASPVVSSPAPPPRLPSSSRVSPLMTPLGERRVSLVSLGAPLMSGLQSPGSNSTGNASKIGVPSVRDLRSSVWQNAICTMNPTLAAAVRAAVHGQATVSSDGRVESGTSSSRAATPTPSTPLSPRTPRIEKGTLTITPALAGLDLQRRPSNSSTSGSSTGGGGGSSTPGTPRQGSVLQVLQSASAPELLINRQLACHQLMLNLVSYLPPLSAQLFAALPSSPAISGGGFDRSSSPIPGSNSGALKRVYVGLSVGPSAGKIYYEERMLWPVSFTSSDAPQQQSASGTTAASVSPLVPASVSPTSPPMLSQSRSSSSSASPSVDGGPSDSAAHGGPPAPHLDDSVALSVYLLLDSSDVDSKQVTFVGTALQRAGADTQQLMHALYKRDFTVPNASKQAVLQMHGHASNHTPVAAAAHFHQPSSILSGSSSGGTVTPGGTPTPVVAGSRASR